MTDEERGLLQTICAEPLDDTARLVFADWLDEHSCPERAEFIRVQVELSQCIAEVERSRRGVIGCCNRYADRMSCDCILGPEHLRRRERELWTATHAREWGLGEGWRHTLHTHTLHPDYGATAPAALVSRGFVNHITCPADVWLRHANAIAWRPDWEVECPRCVERSDENTHYMRRYGGLLCATCHTHHPPGRVPAPFPGGAQPITDVTLTTPPHERDFGTIKEMDRRANTAEYYRWPGITFTLPR